MAVVSVRIYRVKMPDGKFYATSGKSKNQFALDNGILVSNVRKGADLLRMPMVSVYRRKMKCDDKV